MNKTDIVERLQEYASDWRIRTGSVEVVTEAIGTIASLRTELQEARRRIEELEASGNPDGEAVCCGICTPTCAELRARRAALAERGGDG